MTTMDIELASILSKNAATHTASRADDGVGKASKTESHFQSHLDKARATQLPEPQKNDITTAAVVPPKQRETSAQNAREAELRKNDNSQSSSAQDPPETASDFRPSDASTSAPTVPLGVTSSLAPIANTGRENSAHAADDASTLLALIGSSASTLDFPFAPAPPTISGPSNASFTTVPLTHQDPAVLTNSSLSFDAASEDPTSVAKPFASENQEDFLPTLGASTPVGPTFASIARTRDEDSASVPDSSAFLLALTALPPSALSRSESSAASVITQTSTRQVLGVVTSSGTLSSSGEDPASGLPTSRPVNQETFALTLGAGHDAPPFFIPIESSGASSTSLAPDAPRDFAFDPILTIAAPTLDGAPRSDGAPEAFTNFAMHTPQEFADSATSLAMRSLKDGGQIAVLKVTPENLGPVTAEIAFSKHPDGTQRLSMTLTLSNNEAMNMAQQGLSDLHQSLAAAGIAQVQINMRLDPPVTQAGASSTIESSLHSGQQFDHGSRQGDGSSRQGSRWGQVGSDEPVAEAWSPTRLFDRLA